MLFAPTLPSLPLKLLVKIYIIFITIDGYCSALESEDYWEKYDEYARIGHMAMPEVSIHELS